MAAEQEDQQQREEHLGVELDEDQFCCSVCLELLKEPVTIYCGHSYCRGCIEGCWDQEQEKGEFSCPQCRETFIPRPVLRRNNMLAEVVKTLKKTSTKADRPPQACGGPADVFCDFCSGTSRTRAAMSCLTCLASYCAAHLQPHYSVPVLKKHQLVSATVPLQDKMCAEHNKLMEFCCETDKQLVCSMCTLTKHKWHKFVSVSALKDKTKNHLDSSQKKVQKEVQQREEELQELSRAEESVKSRAQASLQDCDQIFGQLICSMQQRCSEVKRLVSAQEKAAVGRAEELKLQLEEEISRLRRRDAELEQLSHTDDHVYVMQVPDVLSTSCDSPEFKPAAAAPLRSFHDVTDCVSELRDELEVVLKDAWPRIATTVSYVDFSLPPAPKSREEFLRYCRPLTLDVTSSYPYLHLIQDNLRMRPSPSSYSAHPDRFTKVPQVLCREGLSERCYWELEWHARTLSAAVAYKDISRTSDQSQFGRNDKSWSLECTADGYLFRHNNIEKKVSGPPSCRVGVYLDYKAGALSFYHVNESMVLIHQVLDTFTQPLHPGVGLNYEWYDVGVFAQLVKLW
ncbi:tripartite motif-containing protein 47-like [Stegastes partitus]|uniref:Tripartite motif-containing protein 47-like n=1 Tax=Stegastes partitus TaxID=144197 RepID=A0A9Y4TVP2_9TELE|nr:PREDICTED: tripartite motif-containing protein 47-like [Stegastes partitus]